ncbi:unnamed protein product [Rotaria magnacalcarata]|uniref:STIL N-terminal domain-containing protein n=2 Tax=Rotaria magnacalcarata TaxID=392030 RepID=A0A814DSQ0_9BILA|nr:unnamed protein product [Rotaria magnacalcarata]CAF1671291.1 unnamed protein product [Rotaria magnacalcarata]
MLQSDKATSSPPLWSIDRKITRQTTPRENTSISSSTSLLISSLWDSTPIGKSIYLRSCQREQLSPQLILEDKVFRSAIRLQHGSTYRAQLQFVGTLIIDDETQRLTYVIDRLQLSDSTTNETNNQHSLLPSKQLNGEFLIPIRCDNKSSTTINSTSSLIQEGIKIIDVYCRSSLPIELHQFSFLHGQMLSRLSPSINADLSFDLLTIKNSFKLAPINSEYVQILPTALLKNLSSPTGNGVYINQPHFGYCGLDRMSKNKILLILENDPQACALPLVGIWVSGIVDVQCAFVWAACLRYCMNSSLKQRLRTGININNTTQQSFLLACYLSTSRGQCDFYEVSSMTTNSTPSTFMIDYDLWTCSKKIIMPNPSTMHSHDTSVSTQLPYDFEFKHVYDGPKMHALLGAHTGNISLSNQYQTTRSTKNAQLPADLSFLTAEIPSDDDNDDNGNHHDQIERIQQEHHLQTALSSPNTNGSLFGVPRLPPKQSIHQSPSWDSISTTTMTTPKWIGPVPTIVPSLTVPAPTSPPTPVPIRFSSLAPSTIAPSTISPSTAIQDAQWKEEMLEKMQAYDAHIQSLNALVSQLLATQQQQQQQLQQSSISTPTREPIKCDVAVQSEPPSPCTSDDIGESASMVKSNRNSSPSSSPKIEHLQHYQQQTPIMTITTRTPCSTAQFPSPLSLPPPQPSIVRQPEPVIDYASLRKSADAERLTTDNICVPYHHTPIRSMSPSRASVPTDLNPVDILKPFFQFMASQQHKQQQEHEYQRCTSPLMTTSKSFDTAIIKTVDEESGRQAEKMSQLANVIQQQQHVTSTTTTGISFISNGLQMQIINQQSSTTTVYPPVPPSIAPPAPSSSSSALPTSVPSTPLSSGLISSSNQQSENDLSIEVRSLQMKYLDDDQLAIATDYDRQSPTPPSTVRQSPQSFDKNMSFATQKYFQKYNIVTGYNRQQQNYLSSDDNDLLASSPPRQRMLLPLLPPSSPPIFTQPPVPRAQQAKILDLSQIRKLPKLL